MDALLLEVSKTISYHFQFKTHRASLQEQERAQAANKGDFKKNI